MSQFRTELAIFSFLALPSALDQRFKFMAHVSFPTEQDEKCHRSQAAALTLCRFFTEPGGENGMMAALLNHCMVLFFHCRTWQRELQDDENFARWDARQWVSDLSCEVPAVFSEQLGTFESGSRWKEAFIRLLAIR